MGSNFLKDFYKKIKRRAHKKEHYDPHELKVAKILKTKKKKGCVCTWAALKLCLKPQQERHRPAVWKRWWFLDGMKKRKDDFQTRKEEWTLVREKWVKRLGFRDQTTTLDRLNSSQCAKKMKSWNATNNLWQILVKLGSGQLGRPKKGMYSHNCQKKKKTAMHFEDCPENSRTVY